VLLQCDLDAMRGKLLRGSSDLSEILLLDEMIAVLDSIGHCGSR
jgi:hypothetical protein